MNDLMRQFGDFNIEPANDIHLSMYMVTHTINRHHKTVFLIP